MMHHPSRFIFFVASVVFAALLLVAVSAAHIPSTSCYLVGTNAQNGWSFVAVSEGKTVRPPSQNPAARFIERVHQLLHKQDIYPEGFRGILVQSPMGGPASNNERSTRGYVFTCALGNGFIYPLQVMFLHQEVNDVSHRLFCELPIVPVECRTVDVILTRNKIVVARWRISNPPHLKHNAIAHTATAWVDPMPGIRLKAGWAPRGFCSSPSPVVSIDLADSSNSDRHLPAHESVQWYVKGLSARYEWEQVHPHSGFGDTQGWLELNGQEQAMNDHSTLLDGSPVPFPITQRIELSGVLEKHVQKTELATFCNVPIERRGADWFIVANPKMLTQRTPDGVTVTIIPQGAQKRLRPNSTLDAPDTLIASYSVVLSPRGKPMRLPTSILSHKYKHPITVYGPHNGRPVELLNMLFGYDNAGNDDLGAKEGLLEVHRTGNHKYCVDIKVPFLEDTIAESAPFASTSEIWPESQRYAGTISTCDSSWRM